MYRTILNGEDLSGIAETCGYRVFAGVIVDDVEKGENDAIVAIVDCIEETNAEVISKTYEGTLIRMRVGNYVVTYDRVRFRAYLWDGKRLVQTTPENARAISNAISKKTFQ